MDEWDLVLTEGKVLDEWTNGVGFDGGKGFRRMDEWIGFKLLFVLSSIRLKPILSSLRLKPILSSIRPQPVHSSK